MLGTTQINEKGEVLDKEGNVVGYGRPNPTAEGRDFHTPNVFRYPATTKELMEYGSFFYEACLCIAEERNKRYAGPYDPFKNFRLGGDYGIAIRMTDKVSRLLTLLHPSNTTDEAGESIEDTCHDLANYAMLLSALRANERGTAPHAKQTTP